jgi:hypothetical protein
MANNVRFAVSPISFTIAPGGNTEVTYVLCDTRQSLNQVAGRDYGPGPVKFSRLGRKGG